MLGLSREERDGREHAGSMTRLAGARASRAGAPDAVLPRRSSCGGAAIDCEAVSPSARIEVTLLPGARELLALHRSELPQRDDLCGAFCGSLALRVAGIERASGEPVDQDAVALAAGSAVSRVAQTASLPAGEQGRRDYRLSLPLTDDAASSGTSADGLERAIERLSSGLLAVIPLSGPWTRETLGACFELAAARPRPVTLIANFATRHLWGSGATAGQLLGHLLDGGGEGPAPDWDVGHFACVVGRANGPGGDLYAVADTYPSLGHGGVHLQPGERLAGAIERRDMPAGGVLVVLDADEAPALLAQAERAGLAEGLWDNGSVTIETAA